MDRFWDKVDKSGDCWVWTAGKDKFGYGLFRYDGTVMRAHRVAWHLTYGTYPAVARHSCDNPSCVNVAHLDDGTQLDNNKDIWDRDRHAGVFRNDEVAEIRSWDYDDTIIERVVEKYGVEEQAARKALSGQTYKYVEPEGKPVPRQKSKRILSDEEVEQIRLALASPYWGQQGELAKRYGVSRNVIQRIQYGTY